MRVEFKIKDIQSAFVKFVNRNVEEAGFDAYKCIVESCKIEFISGKLYSIVEKWDEYGWVDYIIYYKTNVEYNNSFKELTLSIYKINSFNSALTLDPVYRFTVYNVPVEIEKEED